MKRWICCAVAVLVLAPACLGQMESPQKALQPEWWTDTLADTVAAGDFNKYIWVDTTTAGDTVSASFKGVEKIEFTSSQAGSLLWHNTGLLRASIFSSRLGQYAAPEVYWPFTADEVLTITSKAGFDWLEVHNTGASAATVRIIGQRR